MFEKKMRSGKHVEAAWRAANLLEVSDDEEESLTTVCKDLERWLERAFSTRRRVALKTSATLLHGAARMYQRGLEKLLGDAMELDLAFVFRRRHYGEEYSSNDSFNAHSSSNSDETPKDILTFTTAQSDNSLAPARKRTSSKSSDFYSFLEKKTRFEDIVSDSDRDNSSTSDDEQRSDIDDDGSNFHESESLCNDNDNDSNEDNEDSSVEIDEEINKSSSEDNETNEKSTENSDCATSNKNNSKSCSFKNSPSHPEHHLPDLTREDLSQSVSESLINDNAVDNVSEDLGSIARSTRSQNPNSKGQGVQTSSPVYGENCEEEILNKGAPVGYILIHEGKSLIPTRIMLCSLNPDILKFHG